MTRDRAKVLYDRIVRVLAARGLAIDARTTPADLARRAAAMGEPRVSAFIDGCYYPLIYGDGNTALADGDAEDLVRAIEGPAVADRRVAASDEVPGGARPAAAPHAASGTAPPTAPSSAGVQPGSPPAPSGGAAAGAPLERDWASTIGFAVMGLALTALAIALVATQENGWPALLPGFLALGAYFGASGSRRGRCPRCSTLVSLASEGGSQWISPCYNCDDYLRVQDDRLVPVSAGHVADTEAFRIRWDKAPPPAEWTWPWRDRCWVCGAASTGTVGQLWNPNDKYGLPGGTRIAIPGCEKHQLGTRVSYPFLMFRSYDHWRAFRAANNIGTNPKTTAAGGS